MADYGHEQTDAMLHKLELRVKREYRRTAEEIQGKLEKHLKAFEAKDAEKRKLVEAGKMTKREYSNWRAGQIMTGERWETLLREIEGDLARAEELALQMIALEQPDVYALNHNWGTFETEFHTGVRTGYTLYDRTTVERLIRDTPDLLPPPGPGSKAEKKLMENRHARWNRSRITGEVLQGIMQGEDIPQIAKRMRNVAAMSSKKSVLMARTAVTGAQNRGRVDSYKRAQGLGIEMQQEWVATLDGRTRHEHRLLDGQKVDVGQKFHVEGESIAYPGDPTAPAHLVYNCRCTLIAAFPDDDDDEHIMPDGSDYEAWKNGKPVRQRKRKRGGEHGG